MNLSEHIANLRSEVNRFEKILEEFPDAVMYSKKFERVIRANLSQHPSVLVNVTYSGLLGDTDTRVYPKFYVVRGDVSIYHNEAVDSIGQGQIIGGDTPHENWEQIVIDAGFASTIPEIKKYFANQRLLDDHEE